MSRRNSHMFSYFLVTFLAASAGGCDHNPTQSGDGAGVSGGSGYVLQGPPKTVPVTVDGVEGQYLSDFDCRSAQRSGCAIGVTQVTFTENTGLAWAPTDHVFTTWIHHPAREGVFDVSLTDPDWTGGCPTGSDAVASIRFRGADKSIMLPGYSPVNGNSGSGAGTATWSVFRLTVARTDPPESGFDVTLEISGMTLSSADGGATMSMDATLAATGKAVCYVLLPDCRCKGRCDPSVEATHWIQSLVVPDARLSEGPEMCKTIPLEQASCPEMGEVH